MCYFIHSSSLLYDRHIDWKYFCSSLPLFSKVIDLEACWRSRGCRHTLEFCECRDYIWILCPYLDHYVWYKDLSKVDNARNIDNIIGCGYSVSNPSPAAGRIVGGQEVNPQHSRPYQAFVQVNISEPKINQSINRIIHCKKAKRKD